MYQDMERLDRVSSFSKTELNTVVGAGLGEKGGEQGLGLEIKGPNQWTLLVLLQHSPRVTQISGCVTLLQVGSPDTLPL